MREATTGTPARNASWITSGLFSGQIDGTTSTSMDASAAATRVVRDRAVHADARLVEKRLEPAAIAVVAVIRGVGAEQIDGHGSSRQLR